MNTLKTISPLDGRYEQDVAELSQYFSEMALIRTRTRIEIEYLIALSDEPRIPEFPPLAKSERTRLRSIFENFLVEDAERVKKIEATTNHDVKAVEYFIREKTDKSIHPWIHFGLTSEDVNNLSYSLLWRDGLTRIFLPLLESLVNAIDRIARDTKNISMLSLTHGQPASPSTFGKELAVFSHRLHRQIGQLKAHEFQGKFGGATGTWAAHSSAYPDVDWIAFSKRFIESLGLSPNLHTTQIEAHDSLAESFHQIIRINTILTDLCRDMWFYISRNVLGQKLKKDEVGSSTMPHKINPIQFENAEGNLGIATALLNHLAVKLPVSRMQRDLTDSTALRNQGLALGHSYLAVKNISRGLERISINKTQMTTELDRHWEVLAEAIQTILRKSGRSDAYEQLKSLTRGQTISAQAIKTFVDGLDISEDDKRVLSDLTPEKFIGLAEKLVEL